MQKGFGTIYLLLIVIVVIGLIAGGYYLNKQNSKPSNPQLSITNYPMIKASPIASSSADMSNWKTYTNTKYYYQIRYPNDWKEAKYNIADGSLVLLTPINEAVFITYNPNPQKLSLEQIHKQSWSDKTYQVLTISGKKAIKSELGFYDILLDNGGYLNLSYDGCYGMSCEASSSHIQKFNQILSTFRFD